MHDLLLIVDPNGPRVLVRAASGGWELPHSASPEDHWWQTVTPVNQVAAAIGLKTTTMRCLCIIDDPATAQSRCYYALELRAPAHLDHTVYRWLAQHELAQVPFVAAEQQAIITTWFSGAPSRVAWYNPAYAPHAEAWAVAQLALLDRHPNGPFEQVRSWERSALWRVPSAEGMVYLKAVPAVFKHEPALSAALARWLPNDVAPVLAHDATQGLLLFGDGGAQSLADHQEATLWANTMNRFATMQIALAERVEAMLALGTPDRRLHQLPAWLDALFADEVALRRGEAGLSDAEIAALRARGPALHAACIALAHANLPASLDHGDFSPNQVLLSPEGNPRFIDWSDSSVTHPFLSMIFLVEPAAHMPDVEQPQRFVRNAYLTPWERFAPRAQLEQLLDLALLLAPIHHALIYHRTILPALENGWEMERMLPYYLRQVLR